MCNIEPSLASSALMALMLRRVCVLCLLAVSFCLLACQWLVTCAHARVSVSMRGYPETTSASKPALMKQQKRIPTTTAERSTILDPILWACSSESCLIVFPFCEVALCCACARCFLFVWWLVFRCETVLSVVFFFLFFFPLKRKWSIPWMCDETHLLPLPLISAQRWLVWLILNIIPQNQIWHPKEHRPTRTHARLPLRFRRVVHYFFSEVQVAGDVVFSLLVYFLPLNQQAVRLRVQQPLNRGLSHDCSPEY